MTAAIWSAEAAAQSKQCLENACFSERQVRDFEVIDSDTVVIYVGRDRCAYRIKVDPLYCDLKFLPDISFFDARERKLNDRILNRNSSDDTFIRPRIDSSSINLRVCTYSSQLALETYNFAGTPNEVPLGQAPCEIKELKAINDDELLETYVEEGLVPPPPPVGVGDLSRADEGGLEGLEGLEQKAEPAEESPAERD